MSDDTGHSGLEFSPEPSAEELRALLLALARPPEDGRSAWWREGVRDALERDD